jgi:hypothetical protein
MLSNFLPTPGQTPSGSSTPPVDMHLLPSFVQRPPNRHLNSSSRPGTLINHKLSMRSFLTRTRVLLPVTWQPRLNPEKLPNLCVFICLLLYIRRLVLGVDAASFCRSLPLRLNCYIFTAFHRLAKTSPSRFAALCSLLPTTSNTCTPNLELKVNT